MDAAAGSPVGIRHPLLRVLVYGHVWLALGAAAQVWWMQTMMMVNERRAPLLAFCGTFVFYAFMRMARMDHPGPGASPHLRWCRRHKRAMLVSAALLSIAAAILVWSVRMEVLRLLWPAASIALFYVIPMRFTGGRALGLRHVPGVKAFLIAFVWASTSQGLASAFVPGDLDRVVWLVPWLLQFASFLSLAIVFDLRDLPHDPLPLRTIPQVLGARASKWIAVMLQLPWLLFLVAAMVIDTGSGEGSGVYHLRLLMPSLGIALTMLLIMRSSAQRSEAYYLLGIDGMLILVPLLGWVGRLL